MKKKSILIINARADKTGGVEILLHNFIDALKDDYDVSLLSIYYPAGLPLSSKNALKDLYFFVHPESNLVLPLIDIDHCYRFGAFTFLYNHLGPMRRSISRRLTDRLSTVKFEGLYFDTVIAMQEGLPSIIAEKIPCQKKLAWVHTDFSQSDWPLGHYPDSAARRDNYASFDHVVFVSEHIRKSFIEAVGDTGNLIVRYNPIHTDEIIRSSMRPTPPLEWNYLLSQQSEYDL